MSKQLAIAAAFSTFASCALALLAPGSAKPSDMFDAGGEHSLTAPAFSIQLPDLD